MKRTGAQTEHISFPLGGIGTGSVGLAGNGHLVDWEIFNHPDKGRFNGLSHFLVRAERRGRVIDARVLQGDVPVSALEGATPGDTIRGLSGKGFGPPTELMAGWPHFRSWSFEDAFPAARIRFRESAFPGSVSLTAWSPFVPGDSRASSMPVAVFDIELRNTTRERLFYSCVGVLANTWWWSDGCENRVLDDGRALLALSGLPEDDPAHGELALSIAPEDASAPGAELSSQESWYGGGWHDSAETYWRDVMRGGSFAPRSAPRGRRSDHGHGVLCLRFPLAPGETRRTRFVLSWCVPVTRNDWDQDADQRAAEAGVPNRWRNWYATQWPGARESAAEFFARSTELERGSRTFADALRATTLPAPVLDGAAASLCVLRSPTCLRLEDGTFYGWEGTATDHGSCPGSCTHVWNYAQALPFLFPDLERSMREAHLRYDIDQHGGARFRIRLPLGIPVAKTDFRPCADGQFGDVMKIFRDWRVSGDTAWLRAWWPRVRQMVEYAWDEANFDRWDPEETGLLTGRQHHTLDMELFGPNAWLSGMYLGALLAARQMAEAVGDGTFAARCAAVLERGRGQAASLFNGDHFVQRIDLRDRAILERFGEDAVKGYWNAEAGEIKYQIADGVGIDGALGAFFASLWGVGEPLDAAQVRRHLDAVLRDNFRRGGLRGVFNPWRCFAVDDEPGVQIATWARGRAPTVPIPYNTECMTGFEWTFAAHLALLGRVGPATEIAAAIRARFDGARRNPFDEFECGGNYARSMAAWGHLLAWSGFRFDAANGFLGFAPRGRDKRSRFRSLWSLGPAWGVFEEDSRGATLSLRHGSFTLRALSLDFVPTTIRIGRKAVPFAVENDVLRLETPVSLRPGISLAAR